MSFIRTLFLSGVLLLGNLTLLSQKAFRKKAHVISAGFSIYQLHGEYIAKEFYDRDIYGNQYAAYGLTANYYSNTQHPYNAKYEYAISDRIGLGLSFGYFKTIVRENRSVTFFSASQSGYYDYENLSAGLRFNYHIGNFKRFDPYGGIGLGYSGFVFSSRSTIEHSFPIPESKPTPFGIPIDISFSIGARYYVWKGLGIFGEIGLQNWALGQAGIVFRVN